MFKRESVSLKPQRERTVTEMNGVKFDSPKTIWEALGIISRQ